MKKIKAKILILGIIIIIPMLVGAIIILLKKSDKDENIINKNLCGPCPKFVPPSPDWCRDGELIPGEKNECGCIGTPICKINSNITPPN